MKNLSNIYSPKLPDAKQNKPTRTNQSPESTWKRYYVWLSDKVISKPQATKSFTVEQLEEQNIVAGLSRRVVRHREDCSIHPQTPKLEWQTAPSS